MRVLQGAIDPLAGVFVASCDVLAPMQDGRSSVRGRIVVRPSQRTSAPTASSPAATRDGTLEGFGEPSGLQLTMFSPCDCPEEAELPAAQVIARKSSLEDHPAIDGEHVR
jgi:hypothetical protein